MQRPDVRPCSRGLRVELANRRIPRVSRILLGASPSALPDSARGPVSGTRTSSDSSPALSSSARDTVLAFYDAINRRDIDGAASCIGENCRYEDLIYPEPFVGQEVVQTFFKKITSNMPDELEFVIDEITGAAGDTVGLTWHVQLRAEGGRGPVPFPFGRGCSFYRVNAQGKIVYARDAVEPATKPGSAALKVLTAVTPLIKAIGPVAADPRATRPLPWFALYAAYWALVMLNPNAPGDAIYATSRETLEHVTHMSMNFFYVNNLLHEAGITVVPNVAEHPTEEALFNFANAWSLMWLPLMLNDKECPSKVNKLSWWTGVMFLTNIFMLPWMAIRVGPDGEGASLSSSPTAADTQGGSESAKKGSIDVQLVGRIFGITALVIAGVSAYWFAEGRPEVAATDLVERTAFFTSLVRTDRVSFAFLVDMACYAAYQILLMGEQGAPAALRFTPFVGQAIWLATGMKRAGDPEDKFNAEVQSEAHDQGRRV